MNIEILKPTGWLLAIGCNLECNFCIFHLFLYGISPESISALLINGISLIDLFSKHKPKFMDSFKISSTEPFHH